MQQSKIDNPRFISSNKLKNELILFEHVNDGVTYFRNW